jgi:hypothetical protein
MDLVDAFGVAARMKETDSFSAVAARRAFRGVQR